MKLNFDIDQVDVIEFGVGRDDGTTSTFASVHVDASVQLVLREMVLGTWDAMQACSHEPEKYEPSEKHASMEHLFLKLEDPLAFLSFI